MFQLLQLCVLHLDALPQNYSLTLPSPLFSFLGSILITQISILGSFISLQSPLLTTVILFLFSYKFNLWTVTHRPSYVAPVLDYVDTDVELEHSLWFPPLPCPPKKAKPSKNKTSPTRPSSFQPLTLMHRKRKKYFSKTTKYNYNRTLRISIFKNPAVQP